MLTVSAVVQAGSWGQ